MIHLRTATKQDAPLLLRYIRELAEWEGLPHKVVTDEKALLDGLFTQPISAYALMIEEAKKPIGFCVYFYNFSTFLGKRGIYIEDLYIEPEFRGKGYGRAVLSFMAKKALAENCGRLEWWVLNDNVSAVEFYRRLQAAPMSDWTVQRLEGETLSALADNA